MSERDGKLHFRLTVSPSSAGSSYYMAAGALTSALPEYPSEQFIPRISSFFLTKTTALIVHPLPFPLLQLASSDPQHHVKQPLLTLAAWCLFSPHRSPP